MVESKDYLLLGDSIFDLVLSYEGIEYWIAPFRILSAFKRVPERWLVAHILDVDLDNPYAKFVKARRVILECHF